MPTSKVNVQIKLEDKITSLIPVYLQEWAYLTYAHNIQVSKDLDVMFASCPGYLERSRRA